MSPLWIVTPRAGDPELPAAARPRPELVSAGRGKRRARETALPCGPTLRDCAWEAGACVVSRKKAWLANRETGDRLVGTKQHHKNHKRPDRDGFRHAGRKTVRGNMFLNDVSVVVSGNSAPDGQGGEKSLDNPRNHTHPPTPTHTQTHTQTLTQTHTNAHTTRTTQKYRVS